MKIKLKRDILINKFLTPISRLGAERCAISIFPDHIESLVTTEDTNPILYAKIITKSDIGSEKEVKLNIPNVSKLNRMLNCITSDEIELDINSNNIEYNSLNMNFKYHLLEEGTVEGVPVKVDKINNQTSDTDFIIEKDRVADIMKAGSFATDSNKLYFYMKDNTVFAELTDKNVANTDSVAYAITNEYNGTEIKKAILIDLEIFKMFSGLKEDIITKVNTKTRVITFKFEGDDYTLQYIVTPYVK